MSQLSTLHNSARAKPILILLAGKTFPDISKSEGDFDDWIARGLGNSVALTRMDAREVTQLPDPSELAGVVISGSHAMVTEHQPWSEHLAQWLATCVQVRLPVLGICFGHQLLAYAVGGKVAYRAEGIEIGTEVVELSENAAHDFLFNVAPPRFPAQLVHSQSVLELPPEAIVLARGEHESHQAFRIGTCAWGVQFHPEFSAQVMRGYIDQVEQKLLDQQRAPQLLKAAVQDTPAAAQLLQRFARLCEAPVLAA